MEAFSRLPDVLRFGESRSRNPGGSELYSLNSLSFGKVDRVLALRHGVGYSVVLRSACLYS